MLAHNISVQVFVKEWEDEQKILAELRKLMPADLEKEKIAVKKETASGFGEKKITIYSLFLSKQKHIKLFLENLINKLPDDQLEILKREIRTRIDENLHFFLRLDKDKLLKQEYYVTNTGNCFHIKISLAAFPKNLTAGLEVAKKILLKSD